MPHSALVRVQVLADLLQQLGVAKIVISPGSRNGPLTTEFSARSVFDCYSVVDERAAGFFALGMALECKEMTAVCCTSGSAAVNYYPAVVEAFYQSIPLIILTADRPTEMVDQFDGQTIRQWGVFSKHLKFNFQWDAEPHHPNYNAQIEELERAIREAKRLRTPIHINIPFAEPLYELVSNVSEAPRPGLTDTESEERLLPESLKALWNRSRKKLVLVGKSYKEQGFLEAIAELAKPSDTVVLVESTSNSQVKHTIGGLDNLLFNWENLDLKALKPDLLVTLGQNVVSKKVKQFLRGVCPENYWHIHPFFRAETYGAVSEHLQMQPITFLNQINPLQNLENPSEYAVAWEGLHEKNVEAKQKYLAQIPYCDLWVHQQIISKIPREYVVHYGNSSPIRYSQLFPFPHKNIIHCNRGTSGIEGSTSTAIGAAKVSAQPHLLVTGDISFFYEMNALWNNYTPATFRLILINNQGGNIFEIIPGPENTGALKPFFTTPHTLRASELCRMFDWVYDWVDNEKDFDNKISAFWLPSQKPKLLEIDTSSAPNAQILREYFREK